MGLREVERNRVRVRLFSANFAGARSRGDGGEAICGMMSNARDVSLFEGNIRPKRPVAADAGVAGDAAGQIASQRRCEAKLAMREHGVSRARLQPTKN